jgi:MFS family permease
MRLPRMLEPLRIRDFALLWTGMTTSLVGDFIFLIAYPWQTYQLTNNPATLGWISALYFAPTVILLTAGGVLTDRVERRWLMIAADALRAIAIGTGAVLAITHQLTLWELGLVVAFGGVGQALFAPAFGSIVPELVPRDLLAQANSLDMFVRTSAGLVGPAIAGVVIAVAGAGWAFAADAATFVVSTGTAFALTPRPFERSTERRSAWREAREGFGFVRRHTWLWATLGAGAFVNIASGARNVLLPFVIKYDLHATARVLGLVYAAGSAGALISSLVYGQRGLPHRPVLVAYVGWTLSIGAIIAYGLARNVPELLGVGFAGGIGMALGNAIWGTLMHTHVPRHILGRVTSIDWMVSLSLWPVGAAAAGLVANAIGARATLIGAGAIGIVACLGPLAAFRSKLEPPGKTGET